ncbi:MULTISPECIES: S9 family peptidase [Corynebacterium]|uniref:Protease n=1 Tax=Corynebacterium flavescens TaxID=28028 RepID=A0A1L7CP42_CORFL|nr:MULTISPECIES: S9 family peptidase [Corynebacterium]APT87591.1 protease 2 [Corynebacterium flavescens]KAA8719982.1 S9 family peptidase [Corynebacterium flavescens]MDN6430745.1 S9 family peptidase [Corynebacterium flavescens]MDN6531445.1 S9 family peptidase [Corynebacterium flavescens]MDN6600870.1 S9 family peptidase [Corynebacterium flavescens]
MTTQPPVAPKHPTTRQFHGRTFVDNYEWLRDKKSPETLAYLNAENDYTAAKTAHLEQMTENIFQEIKSRVKETDMSVPTRRGGYWYYGRSEEGKNYGYSCRIPVAEGSDPWAAPTIPEEGSPAGEQIILDANALAEGHEFFSIGAASVSDSGRYLAYSVDYAGDERFSLSIRDLETGQLLEDRLEGIFYGATWVGDSFIFYSTVDDAWRPDTVWRHKVGTPQSADVAVFREEDQHFNVSIGGSRSDKYLFIGVGSKITSEMWVLEQDNPEGEFRSLWERKTGVEYDVDHAVVAGRDYWVVTHNATGPNFEVGYTGVDKQAPLTQLEVLLPHRDNVRVEGVDTYRDQIVASYRRDGIGRAAVMRLGDAGFGEFSELTFNEELYSVAVGGNPEWDAPVLRVSYVSYIQPAQLFDYRVDTGAYTLLKEQEVPGGYDKEEYVAYRLWATAADGTEIPISVVHRADLDRTRPQPLLLYGYGSYESSMDPGFSVTRLSLMDRGMIYAVAHVRGGGEMGRKWYDEGKLLQKKNTFTDFIAVADELIASGVSTPEHMVAEGGSAGGMLMGAVANMAPDRFRAIQAVVPFVDPLTSILMPELPLTVTEWEEWGDPYHDSQVYDYMESYSPYENVEAKDYPDILAITSLNDTRVLYVEPAKWIAKLRATATGGEFLLKTEMVAGHGGVSGRYDKWRQGAFEYAWTINKATSLER